MSTFPKESGGAPKAWGEAPGGNIEHPVLQTDALTAPMRQSATVCDSQLHCRALCRIALRRVRVLRIESPVQGEPPNEADKNNNTGVADQDPAFCLGGAWRQLAKECDGFLQPATSSESLGQPATAATSMRRPRQASYASTRPRYHEPMPRYRLFPAQVCMYVCMYVCMNVRFRVAPWA